MRKLYLLALLVVAFVAGAISSRALGTARAAEGDYTQPTATMRALWAGYSVDRGAQQLVLQVVLRDSTSNATRFATVIYQAGQRTRVIVDGQERDGGTIPAGLASAYSSLSTALSSSVSALATGGAFNVQ